MKALSASRLETYRLVKLPSAAPYIFAGLDMGIVYALLGTIVAEFLGAQEGMGVVITKAQAVTDVAGVFAVLTILGVTGIALHLDRAPDAALADPLGRSRTTLGRENRHDQSPQGRSRHRRDGASVLAMPSHRARAGAAQDPHGLRHQVGQSDRHQHPDLGAGLGYTKEEGLQFTPAALGTNSNAQIAVDKGDIEFARRHAELPVPAVRQGPAAADRELSTNTPIPISGTWR